MTTWQSGDIFLYHGDCLKVLPTLRAENVSAFVTDPPYGLKFAYASYNDTRENLIDLIANFMPRVLELTSHVFVLCGITQVCLYPPPQWIACVTWDTTGSFGKYGYTQWMPLLCYGNDLPGFGNVNGVTKNDVLRISGGAGVGFLRSQDESLHTCPKPLNLMIKTVNRFVLSNGTVLDPFMGIGTTGVACVQTERRFIGIEIDRDYFDIAVKRIEQAQM